MSFFSPATPTGVAVHNLPSCGELWGLSKYPQSSSKVWPSDGPLENDDGLLLRRIGEKRRPTGKVGRRDFESGTAERSSAELFFSEKNYSAVRLQMRVRGSAGNHTCSTDIPLGVAGAVVRLPV